MAVLTPSVNLRNTGTVAYMLGYALQHSETGVMDGKMFFI